MIYHVSLALGPFLAPPRFMESTAQKLNVLGDQLEEKASELRLEQLEDRLAKALQGMERKAELTALKSLEEQLLELGGYVETKADMAYDQNLCNY